MEHFLEHPDLEPLRKRCFFCSLAPQGRAAAVSITPRAALESARCTSSDVKGSCLSRLTMRARRHLGRWRAGFGEGLTHSKSRNAFTRMSLARSSSPTPAGDEPLLSETPGTHRCLRRRVSGPSAPPCGECGAIWLRGRRGAL